MTILAELDEAGRRRASAKKADAYLRALVASDANLCLRLFLDLPVTISRNGLLQRRPLIEHNFLREEEIEDMLVSEERELVRALLAHGGALGIQHDPYVGLYSFASEF